MANQGNPGENTGSAWRPILGWQVEKCSQGETTQLPNTEHQRTSDTDGYYIMKRKPLKPLQLTVTEDVHCQRTQQE